MSVISADAGSVEVAIIARWLDNGAGGIPEAVARYILDLRVDERDQARKHALAEGNRRDDLTPAEREEMHAFGEASTLLSILKSRARRILGVTLDLPTAS